MGHIYIYIYKTISHLENFTVVCKVLICILLAPSCFSILYFVFKFYIFFMFQSLNAKI
jgi:hypothetical protein